VNASDAIAFVDWLEPMDAQRLVRRFGVER
jgi:hypothetical protein